LPTPCIINCLSVYEPIGKFSEFSSGASPFAIFSPNATNHTQNRCVQFDDKKSNLNSVYNILFKKNKDYQNKQIVYCKSFTVNLLPTKTSESNRNQKEFEARNPDFTFQFESELKKIYEENELFGDFIFTVVDENGLVF